MKTLLIFSIALLLQDVPYRAKETFEIKLDYQFKQRPVSDKTAIHFDETKKEYERRTSTSPLPYLVMNLHLLEVSEGEVRLRVTNNVDRTSFGKKVARGTIVPIDFGFTDDVKDKVTANEYTITFLSDEKQPLSRIHIFIDEDGGFFVNGEKRGKF